MLVQWCLKGVPQTPGFGDLDAVQALSRSGLTSNWVRANPHLTIAVGWPDAHVVLSDTALVAHVNAYGKVRGHTPYLSLTAGVIERDSHSRMAIHHPAWTTALDFATKGKTTDGYVFECWIQLPGNPAPELPGFGEEVRDLNIHPRFAWWHDQGEILAKLVVPPRQIRRVLKFDRNLARLPLVGGSNPDFVPPERISNIRGIV